MSSAPAAVSEVGRLPDGFRVRLAAGARVLDGGRVLVGGSPLTTMRLARTALQEGVLEVRDDSTARLADRLLDTNLAHPDPDSTPAAASCLLTVVIPVRDRVEELHRLLSKLRSLDCVVVDDASHDQVAIAAVTQWHGARLVRLDVNVGPGAARNAGLARVGTPFVALVDSDVHVVPAQLLALAGHLADPRVALVGPRIRGVSSRSRLRWFERYEEDHSSLSLGRHAAVVRPGSRVGWLPAACLVGRSSDLWFDPDLRVGEDVDLVWRLTAAGRRVRYEPGVVVGHDTRDSISSWLGRKAVYGASGASLAERHGPAVAPAVLSPALAGAALAVLARRPWSPLAAAAAWGASTYRLRKILPPSPERPVVAGTLALRSLGWALRQEAALALRHWWPAAVPVAATRSGRRFLATALAVDAAAAWVEARDKGALPSPSLLVARRLDDLAYGAGLWYGAARARSARALRPRRPASPRTSRRETKEPCS